MKVFEDVVSMFLLCFPRDKTLITEVEHMVPVVNNTKCRSAGSQERNCPFICSSKETNFTPSLPLALSARRDCFRSG